MNLPPIADLLKTQQRLQSAKQEVEGTKNPLLDAKSSTDSSQGESQPSETTTASTSSSSATSSSKVGFNSRRSKKNFRKRNRTENENEDKDLELKSPNDKSKDEDSQTNGNIYQQAAKRAKKTGGAGEKTTYKTEKVGNVETFTFESDRSIILSGADATRELDIDTEKDRDHQALHEKAVEAQTQELVDDEGNRIYKGMNAYKDYSGSKNESMYSKGKTSTIGPIRSSANVRNSAVIDYQPNVCKDYKETGHCGYGDACIHLHDRGDYLQGWQIDQKWEEEQAEKEKNRGKKEKKEEEVPFACHICRKRFTNPVRTKCGHYFCQKCALTRFRKTAKCAVCKAQTDGSFAIAKDLMKRLEKRAEILAQE